MKTLDKLKKKFLWKVQGFFETKGQFIFGNCVVSYAITTKYTDIEVYNPLKGTFLDNVAEYLKTLVEEPVEVSEHEANGFRNESDYLNYKYG